ncbi:cation diffusion facilitator family transporter [Isoptericola variabilis]|uniref:Cation diffusion facilitator family transporter n=1 Tax=Isoptericola variabilis (strain 225) TaxID=743718 RepID=F6FWA4_ISOV2|nr:cation diffusion facilitator family transporter [Isoptericola variabilis]AEG45648.1 cation diffusion facilitator family transporter [Isoptericola variabilis 225]TWH28810.1 cation diffusion facilitator family transporter [Isoptericola variabilis J7]
MTGVEHAHPAGFRGWLHEVFVPHSHDAADSVDGALEASAQGIRAVKVSLLVLGATAVAQLGIALVSGSVALLADTIHNFSDALTAVPLWIAFVLGRRAATRRYTHGFGRVEDLAGLFVVAMIALSAVVAGVESVRRLADPQPLEHLGWVAVAGVVGFAGNEAVAVYRIRTGRRIGSAALVADGVHARTDGFTSLAVVLGVLGVSLGFPQADPIVGLLITAAILVLLWGTARDVGRVDDVRLRWSGHRLVVQARLGVAPALTVSDGGRVAADAEASVRAALPSVGRVDLALVAA